jgi:hypothetical protein
MNRRDFVKSSLIGFPLFSGNLPESQDTVVSSGGRRCRLQDLGIKIGDMEPGPHNAITDIRGVKVGHTTIIKGQGNIHPPANQLDSFPFIQAYHERH